MGTNIIFQVIMVMSGRFESNTFILILKIHLRNEMSNHLCDLLICDMIKENESDCVEIVFGKERGQICVFDIFSTDNLLITITRHPILMGFASK